MGAPAGFNDFYELELKINYNNANDPYLQGLANSSVPPMERQAGWTERYISNVQPAGAFPLAAMYTLVQARAALLGLNFYIKSAIGHQASVFKSTFPLPNSASKGLIDSVNSSTSLASQYCSSPEETILLRNECGNLYRFEHQIRGVKDYLADDAMAYFLAPSYANLNPAGDARGIFDTLAQVIPAPNSTGGVAATVAVTLTNGAITGTGAITGGNYPGVANGQYNFFAGQAGFSGTPAFGTATITAGAVTAVTIQANQQGAGYQAGSVTVPVSNDPYGLPNYMTPGYYWANFMAALIAYTGSGPIQRVSQTTFTGTQPSFPSGLVPVLVGSVNPVTRVLFQRVGNRQTGQIRLTKPARVRRGI